MEAMTLEQSAYLAEIVGVFAIVASLVYLGFQVRQNTRTTRLETVQAISTERNSWMDMIASSRDLAETYHRGTFDFQRLDATQKITVHICNIPMLPNNARALLSVARRGNGYSNLAIVGRYIHGRHAVSGLAGSLESTETCLHERISELHG